MKSNGLTTKDEATFLKEYSTPEKSRELHRFMTENELTTKDENSFYSEYFAPKGASSEVGAASGVDSNAPQQPSIPSGASPEYLKQLSEKNFVKRINNPSKFIKNADGSKSTHKMATAEVDGKQIAFPTIVEQNGKLVELPINEAIDFALKNNEFAEFAKAEDAQWYAEGGYKKGTPLENLEKSPQQADGNTLLPSGLTLDEQRRAVLSHASKITPQQDRKLSFVQDNEKIPFSTRQKALKGTQFESVAPLSEQPIAGERNKQLESQVKQNERQNEKSSLAVLAESHRNNLSKDVDYKTTQEKFNSAYENWQNGQGSPEDVKLAESELNSQLELLDRDYIGNEATKRGALAFMEKKDKYDQITSKVKAGESISETEKKFLYDLRKDALSAKAASERVALMDIEDSVDIDTFNKEMATLSAMQGSMTADEYNAKVQEITQRTGVNQDVINSLDLGYKELASTVELSKVTEAQNRNIETERGLDKMRSEQRKEGAYMIPEALRGLVGAMGTMTLSAAKLPKSLMGLDDETKYDWTDKLYDFAENEVDESQGTWGALQDAPAYLKYSYMLGQGVGSVAMFAAGGGVSAAVGMPSTVGTIGTAFIMSQPDNYTEGINSGMSAQEARIYSNVVSSAEAFAEGIIPDSNYFKNQLKTTILSAYKKTGSVKEALKVVPKVIEGMAVSGSKEGAEEVVQTFAGDVTKSFLDTVAGSEYYNSTWNTESYKDAILSGALTGGFMKMFGSSSPKSEDTLNVMRDMIDSRESIVSNIAKFNPELSTQVDEVLSKAEEAKAGLESHSKWNDLTTAAQNKALDLVWQMELAEDAKKRVEQFGIVDENRNKESERLAKELNDVFTDDANTKRYADTVIRQLQQARAELGVEFDPMEDLPESVVKTFDRVDEGLPTDPVAVKEASDWLYSKYKQLSEMKNDDNRKLTIEQIEAIQLQLGEDIDKLENYRNENEQQQRTEEKTQPETEATDGAITEAEKQQIREEIITLKAPEITVESNTAEVLEEVKQGEDGIVEPKTELIDGERMKDDFQDEPSQTPKTELIDGGQTEEIKSTDNVSESNTGGGVDGGSGVDGVLEGGEDVKAGTEAKGEQPDASDVETFELVENEGKWKATTKTYKGRETGNWVFDLLDKKQKSEYEKIKDEADTYGTKEQAEVNLKKLQDFESKNKEAFVKAKEQIDNFKQAEQKENKDKADRQKVYDKTANQLSELSDLEFEKLINLIDKDVKSTLEKRFGDRIEKKQLFKNRISEAYHQAKADGSNPELVKAVESLLSKEPSTEKESEVVSESELSKEGFTESKVLNQLYSDTKKKYGDKKGAAIYDAATRLVNPNKNEIVEIRSNGVVVKEGNKFMLLPFGNTDANSKKWTLYKGIDVTDQFNVSKEPAKIDTKTEQVDQVDVNKIETKAKELLTGLNEGKKQKDQYELNEDIENVEGYYVISAKNKKGEEVFNLVDSEGKTPNGASANWRTSEIVSQDIRELTGKQERVDQVDTKVENRGNSSEIKFTSEKKVPTTYRLIEADELQPSHLSSGERNPMHQIASAQPKERNDAGSKMAQDKIANDPNIAEVGESPNAYFGAPIVNKRGEVIQGNNRSIGLKKHYRGNGKKYKADLEATAEKFGFTKEQVAGMKNPILVREVDVNDREAIELGQYDVKDLETGGKQRIDPIATSRKISPSDKAKIASIVFSGDFKTIKESIRANSKKVAEVLKAYLNPAQGKNTFNSDGSFTSQGMDDVSAVISNFLFDGGKAVLPEVFDKLPFTAKEGIQKALPYILSVSDNKSLKSHVQNAMLAFYEFNSSGQTNFDAWSNELDLFTGGSPKDAFLPIELAIAKKLIDAKSQNEIKDIFQKYEALTSDKPADMFNEAQEGMSKADAIKQQFNVEYNENEQRTNSKPQSEVSGERVDSGKKAEKTQSTTIFTELDTADKGRSVKARTEAKKALKEKYGDIIEKAKDINKNFDSYVEKLKAKGIITKVEC
jgi:hypothetical protein